MREPAPASTASPITKLIEAFHRLPGVGPKSAQRLAYHVLRAPEEEARALAEALLDVKRSVILCERCQNLADQSPCRLCADDGQLLLTSLDVMASGDERMRNHGQRNRLRGLEPGQQRFRFRYRDVLGGWIDWLHVDPQSLGDAAAETGWRCQVVADEGNGNYLARLSPEISSPDRARS